MNTEHPTKVDETNNVIVDPKTELEIKMLKVQELVKELGLENQISISAIRQDRSEKDDYTVKLSDGTEITFKSSDDKTAKYRAYRIGKDGAKDRPSNLKVVSLINGTRIVQ